MPELPEVETFARQIKPRILNKEISSLVVLPKGERLIGKITRESFNNSIVGQCFLSLNRHGKFLILNLSNSKSIIAHLRMSGRFTITNNHYDEHIHNRLYVKFADNTFLNFIDTRRFATFELIDNIKQSKSLSRLGADAILGEWTALKLKDKLNSHKKIIYKCLLDQSIISGVGNIYANEALFRANISPFRLANSLTNNEIAKLLSCVIDILSTAINFKGTTLLDNSYTDIDGSTGEFHKLLKVYNKEDTQCFNCGSKILREKVSGRSVYYCKKCQH